RRRPGPDGSGAARRQSARRRACARRNPRWCRRISLRAGWSTAFLSVGDAAPDELENGLFHLVDGEAGGVQVDGVGRLGEGSFGAGAVAPVALPHLRGHGFGRNGGALFEVFGEAPADAL